MATRPFDSGGGIINRDGVLNITNSTVSGNVVSGNYGSNNGGGILNRGGDMTLNNVTVTNNTAFGSGSASGVKRAGGTINVKNTIIAGNVNNATVPDTVTNGSGFVSQGYNLIGNVGVTTSVFSQTGDQTGTSAAPLNPMLADLANNGDADAQAFHGQSGD
jgi:hypothetical protein